MEKLFNWTIGSFFRTIGRLIAYFAIGAFIAYILGHSNIDLGGITNLFFVSVNAAEYVDGQDISYYSDQALTNRLPSNGWYDYATINSTTTPNGDFTSTNFWTTPYIYTNDIHSGEITIPFYIAVPRVSTTTTSTIYGQDYCDRWTWGSIDSYNNVIRWDCSHIDQGQDSTITDREYITPQISIQAMVGYENGYIDICRVDTNKNEIVCPIVQNIFTNNIVAITIQSRVYFTSNSTYQYYVGLYRKINRFSNSTNAIIDNNNQNHQETMTIITDTNTTQEQNETTTFFEGFQFSSDSNGLVGVITAPLRVFTAISEGTFSDLCFTLKGKQTCFPNGNMIWQKTERTSSFFGSGSIATGIQAFVTLFNLVAGGYLLYKMGASVKRLTEELIDPTNTRIEVMKL